MSRAMLELHYYADPIIGFFGAVCRRPGPPDRRRHRRPSVVIDAGAFVGEWAHARSPTRYDPTIHAFEPGTGRLRAARGRGRRSAPGARPPVRARPPPTSGSAWRSTGPARRSSISATLGTPTAGRRWAWSTSSSGTWRRPSTSWGRPHRPAEAQHRGRRVRRASTGWPRPAGCRASTRSSCSSTSGIPMPTAGAGPTGGPWPGTTSSSGTTRGCGSAGVRQPAEGQRRRARPRPPAPPPRRRSSDRPSRTPTR